MSPTLRWGLVGVAALVAFAIPPAWVSLKYGRATVGAHPQVRSADFGAQAVSADVQRLAGWIARSGDNAGANFILVDKKFAEIHVFDAAARLRGSTPVLLGSAVGDDTVPGIGKVPIPLVQPDERTTPAGRFVAERGRNLRGEDVLWISYADALSMHPVLTTNPDERRLERLATPTPEDNRVSYGCINIPQAFFEEFLRPVIAAPRAIVYILPEVKPLGETFGVAGL